jgi:Zn-dependent protease with chaperone function
MPLKPNLVHFPGLSHHAFQHPLDRQALQVLEKVPLLPQVTKKYSETTVERFVRIQQISSSLRVNARQYPSLHNQYVRMAQTLDLRKLPELYINTTPQINAYATGIENYFIVIFSGLIDLLSEEELLAVIAHELGHVKCEHMLYMTMVNMLHMFGTEILNNILPGVGPLASLGVQLALLEWYRKAEFSCDRAALLATQEVEIVGSALAKLAGFSKRLDEPFNLEEVRRQADDFEEIGADSAFDKMLKVYVLMGKTHPYPVVRTKEIFAWSSSPEYAQILSGKYQLLAEQTLQLQGLPPPKLGTPTGLCCPRCKSYWPGGTAFCGQCAMSLRQAQAVCGQCFSTIEPDWLNCPRCGNVLKNT